MNSKITIIKDWAPIDPNIPITSNKQWCSRILYNTTGKYNYTEVSRAIIPVTYMFYCPQGTTPSTVDLVDGSKCYAGSSWVYADYYVECPPCYIPFLEESNNNDNSMPSGLGNVQYDKRWSCMPSNYPKTCRIYNSDNSISFVDKPGVNSCYNSCNTDENLIYSEPPQVTQPVGVVTNRNYGGYKIGFKVSWTNILSTTLQCSISSTLPTSPSLWGNDGALDNLPDNCTDITDTRCLLPPNLVKALKDNFNGTMSMRTSDGRGGGDFQCPAGFECITSNTGRLTGIKPCTGGYFCPVNTAMTLCPAGYYCPGNSSPQVCPTTGTTGCTTGSVEPTACTTSGSFCSEGSSSEQTCPAGYYCTTPAAKIPCPSGTYSSSTGRTSVTACQTCQAGYYCTEGSTSATAQQCTAGNYCLAGSGSQKQCPEGHYCFDKTILPTKCPPGIQCPAGTATNYGLVCTGNQRPDPMYTSCVNCQPPPPGAIYKNQSGCDIVKCTGRTQPNAGKTSCDACPTRKSGYIWGSAQGCSEIRCPVGMVPSASGTTCK
jgi:hypothetical protein